LNQYVRIPSVVGPDDFSLTIYHLQHQLVLEKNWDELENLLLLSPPAVDLNLAEKRHEVSRPLSLNPRCTSYPEMVRRVQVLSIDQWKDLQRTVKGKGHWQYDFFAGVSSGTPLFRQIYQGALKYPISQPQLEYVKNLISRDELRALDPVSLETQICSELPFGEDYLVNLAKGAPIWIDFKGRELSALQEEEEDEPALPPPPPEKQAAETKTLSSGSLPYRRGIKVDLEKMSSDQVPDSISISELETGKPLGGCSVVGISSPFRPDSSYYAIGECVGAFCGPPTYCASVAEGLLIPRGVAVLTTKPTFDPYLVFVKGSYYIASTSGFMASSVGYPAGYALIPDDLDTSVMYHMPISIGMCTEGGIPSVRIGDQIYPVASDKESFQLRMRMFIMSYLVRKPHPSPIAGYIPSSWISGPIYLAKMMMKSGFDEEKVRRYLYHSHSSSIWHNISVFQSCQVIDPRQKWPATGKLTDKSSLIMSLCSEGFAFQIMKKTPAGRCPV